MSHKISVLLVEDNPLVRKMSIILFECLNCRVDAVTTGNLAFELANKNSYDIIFMDIGLPDRDGLSVIQDIRRHSKLNQNAPIIALTAHLDRGYFQQSFEVGATEYLVKPINNDIGLDVLQRYVSTYASAVGGC